MRYDIIIHLIPLYKHVSTFLSIFTLDIEQLYSIFNRVVYIVLVI